MTGEEIRAFREARRLSQEALGALVEPPINRHNLSKIEKGRRAVSAGMAARLREAMARATKQG